MVIPDINLLLYAYSDAAAQHVRARLWWEDLLSGDTPVGIPWVVTLGFIKLMTNPRVIVEPLPVSTCLARVSEWFDAPNATPLEPGARHWETLSAVLARLGTGGNLVTDAHLAALAIEHNAELHSNDADFSRVPGLKHFNPLSAS